MPVLFYIKKKREREKENIIPNDVPKITGVQLREPGVGFTPEGRCERRELDKRTEFQNRVNIMSVCFAYYC